MKKLLFILLSLISFQIAASYTPLSHEVEVSHNSSDVKKQHGILKLYESETKESLDFECGHHTQRPRPDFQLERLANADLGAGFPNRSPQLGHDPEYKSLEWSAYGLHESPPLLQPWPFLV